MLLVARFRWLIAAIVATGVLLAGLVPAHAQEETLLAGSLYEDRLPSPILGEAPPFRVYFPPQYFADTQARFPVLYMLHGVGGNYTEWTDMRLPQVADAMIENGEIQPLIIVMPDGGFGTQWLNWDDGPHWSDYLAVDVVDYVDQRFRTLPARESRAIGGHSMGAAGALSIALRYPEVFSTVGAHSPSVRFAAQADELWFVSGSSFFEQNALWLLQNRPVPGDLRIWLDVGEDDWWRENVEAVRDAMWVHGVPFEWHEYSGTHESDYWMAHVPEYLRFYTRSVMGEPPALATPPSPLP